jgi:nucleoid-associated protein YgaU
MVVLVLVPAAVIVALGPSVRVPTDPGLEDVLAALAAGAAMAGALFLLLTTVAHLGAVRLRNPRLIRLTGAVALPAVRRLGERVAAGTMIIGVVASPVAVMTTTSVAADERPVAELVDPAYLPMSMPEHTAPEPQVVDHGYLPVTPAVEAPVAAPVVEQPPEVVVERGDHLWGLAAERLALVAGRPPSDPEIARYWRLVIDQNLARLRSGDPDLVFPGEIIEFPEVPTVS